MTGGRPLRALALLTALIGGWIAGRWPALEADVARLEAVAAASTAVRAPAAVARPGAAPARRPAAAPAAPQQVAIAPARVRAMRPPRASHIARTAVAAAEPLRAPPPPAAASPAVAAPGALPPAAVPPAATAAAPPSAFDLATRAYAEAAHNRRAAARDFAAALAADPGAPNAAAWDAARRALTRRWSASAYSVVRAAGPPDPSVSPLLGGGQSGGGIAFTPDPLAAHPLALTARLTASNDRSADDAEAALGLRFQLRPGLTVSAERIVGVGSHGRTAWTARLAAGGAVRRGAFEADGYGEAGIVTTAPPTGYAAGAARAGVRVTAGAVTLVPGAGAWASVERAHDTVDRIDVGPGVRLEAARLPVTASFDYRFRVAGNARPGSGPVLTIGVGF